MPRNRKTDGFKIGDQVSILLKEEIYGKTGVSYYGQLGIVLKWESGFKVSKEDKKDFVIISLLSYEHKVAIRRCKLTNLGPRLEEKEINELLQELEKQHITQEKINRVNIQNKSIEELQELIQRIKDAKLLAIRVINRLMRRKYFHQLSYNWLRRLKKKSGTYLFPFIVEKLYKRPDWCSLETAVSYFKIGCPSLMDIRKNGLRNKISEKYCESCDFYIYKNSEVPNRKLDWHKITMELLKKCYDDYYYKDYNHYCDEDWFYYGLNHFIIGSIKILDIDELRKTKLLLCANVNEMINILYKEIKKG